MKLNTADKKAINAFLDKKSFSGKKLESNGSRIDGQWLGGRGIAEWKGGKIHFNDLGSKAAQLVQNAIKKEAPKNWLAGSGGSGPFIGPKGGKYKDPAHKIPWTEKGMKYEISLNKGAARGGKYIKRVPKKGGGYVYFYDDGTQKHVDKQGKEEKVVESNKTKLLKEWDQLSRRRDNLERKYKAVSGKDFRYNMKKINDKPEVLDSYAEMRRADRDGTDEEFFEKRNKHELLIIQKLKEKLKETKKSLSDTDLQKAVWPTSHKNDLPDSAFLYIEPGGKKDEEDKTKPRSLRHFPYKNIQGKVDQAHVRNAIARIPQSKCGLSASQMEALQNRARKLLNKDTEKSTMHIDLEKSDYHSSQFKKVKTSDEYGHSIQVRSDTGHTKYLMVSPAVVSALHSLVSGKAPNSNDSYINSQVSKIVNSTNKKDGTYAIRVHSTNGHTNWMNIDKGVINKLDKHILGTKKKQQKGPYIGPKGGKYADPEHKIAWSEKSIGDNNMEKGAIGGKYKRRIAKPGGGYRYEYDEPTTKKPDKKEWPTEDHSDVDQHAHTELQLHADNTHYLYKNKEVFHKNVITKMAQGKYNPKEANKLWMYYADRVADDYAKQHGSSGQTGKTMFDKKTRQALAHTYARDFENEIKDNPKEYSHLVPKKYQKEWGKSLKDNNMNEFKELNDFIKSTIEDEAQASINESKKNGEGQSLAGKGKNSGSPSATGSAPNLGANKPPVKKLSEDDEVDEANMKPHKKPLEQSTRKSLPVSAQKEQMAYEIKKAEIEATRDNAVIPKIGKVVRKAEEPVIKSSDEMAAELAKSDSFYTGGSPKMNWNSPLTSSQACSHCEGVFMKALTVCPHCGK